MLSIFHKQYSFIHSFIYLFIYGCVGSSFLCEGFLQLWRVGATLHRGARASHRRSLSRCRAQAPDAQAQQLWLTGLVAPRHVGSSQTRARTHVPCTGRQIPNHCTTREAPVFNFIMVMNFQMLKSISYQQSSIFKHYKQEKRLVMILNKSFTVYSFVNHYDYIYF